MVDGDERAPIGSRFLERLARMHIGVRGETVRMEGAYKDEWVTAWMERAERELAPIVSDMLGHIGDHESTPGRIRRLIARGSTPTHQVDFIANLILNAVAVVTQLGAITAPFAQDELNKLWVDHPNVPLPPNIGALAALRQATTYAEARDYAAKTGFSVDAFDIIYKSQFTPPPVEALLTMLRRGQIDAGALPDAFQRLGVAPEFVDPFVALVKGPPSSEQAVLAVVQNHLDEASARAILLENGIDDAYYPWLYENAGRPPGPMEMLGAWNRGVAGVNQAWVEQSIREGDIKNKYIPTIIGLREHLLPQKTIVAGVHQGVIPDDKAMTKLLQLGISAENAGYLLAEGHNNKVASHKNVSVSQIETAYEDGSITRAQAQAMLVALNYLAADADFILNLVDVKWQQSLHNATVSRVKSLYLAHKIERTTASSDLDAAGVTAQHRDLYLQQWDLVRATPTRTLTEGQAANAYKKLIISAAQFRARLAALGYASDDVDLIVQLTPIRLTQAQVLKARATSVITDVQARERFREMGLPDGEIDVLFQSTPVIGTPPTA